MKGKFTIGTDPEFFLKETKTGKMISSIPFFTGTKYEPESLPCGAGLQRDNVALEFATPPAEDRADFVSKVQAAFMDIMKRVPKGMELVAEPSANFDQDQLDCPEAKEFGCDPDFDAWVPEVNPAAFCDDPTFRSCGGHVHLGYVEGSGNDFLLDDWGKVHTIRTMDAIHGVISVLLDNSDKAIKRRRLYGKAGCHRPTKYGIEYRTLSNFWLKSPELTMLIYSLSNDVLRLMREEKARKLYETIGAETICDIINGGRVEEATKILEEHIMPVLSGESKELLDLCREKINVYSFENEWKIKEVVA